MRFSGSVYKDGKFWLAEVPMLEALTQGHTKKEAFEMVKDLVETLANMSDFVVTVYPNKDGSFEVGSEDTRTMIRLLLRRQREKSGLSLADVAHRLGAKSRNAYARYERGNSVPTIEKLDELLQAVSPDQDIVFHQSR